jgi:cell division protein FtsB
MVNAVIVLIVVLTLSIISTYLVAKLYKKYKLAYEQEHEKLLGIQEEYSKLVKAYEIRKKNKEKTDAKITDLHDGKLSADDILPKRKN